MFGYYRFFLAMLVLLSHIPIKLQGFDPGVAAVVSFYILAGYVVCKLFSRLMESKEHVFREFYTDRLLRVYPLYAYVTVISIVFLLLADYGAAQFSWLNSFSALTIIPLNYFNDVDIWVLREPDALIIPPAWSLGAELQAYVLLPLVVLFKRIKIVLAALSLVVFIMASCNLINPEKFGYFYLPGVFFMFVLGSCIYKLSEGKADTADHYLPVATYIILLLLIFALGVYEKALIGHAMETVFGVIIGMPIIYYIACNAKTLPFNRFLGDMSYGIFLSHWLAIRCIDYYDWASKDQSIYIFTAVVAVLTFIIALPGVLLIDRKVTDFRLRRSRAA